MTLTKQIAEFEEEKQRTHDRDVLDMIDVTTADLVNTGVITYAYVNADYRLRADPEDVLAAL